MARRAIQLLVTVLCAAVLVAVVYRLYTPRGPQLLWVKDYNPGGYSGRLSQYLDPYGDDQLIEHGLYQNPAVYTLDGRLVWKFTPSDPKERAVHTTFDRGTYIGTNRNNIYALDAQGKVRWKTFLPGTKVWTAWPGVGTNPAYFGINVIYVGVSDNMLYALRSDNGEILWELH
nr:PQQ-binding-like beta-propeller repeat protein [bacterium]